MDDGAILANLDREPDAFAELYRRHAGRLLGYLDGRTYDRHAAADVCAETFAVALTEAHRFDPAQGDAAAWLDGIAHELLARAERRGSIDDRARRRLGMASLEPGETFAGELEEELVAAARFRASRRRPSLPRPPRPPARVVRGALAGVAALALAAVVAVLALGGDDDRSRPPAAASGVSARLVAMESPVRCFGRDSRARPAAPALAYFSVFRYRQRVDDVLPRDVADSLPIATFDPGETRLAANGRRGTRLHVVPSLGVSDDGSTGCAADDGPGVCLVHGGRFRCFGIAAIRDGLAFARTERGSIVGIVSDGIGRVVLSAGGRRASARVTDNVYEAALGVRPGTRVSVELERLLPTACAREVAPALLRRVAALRRAPGERLLPSAALSRLREESAIAEVVERGARFWGAGGGVEFWVVPVAAAGGSECAPARAACVVAVPEESRPDAECDFGRPFERPDWRFSPLLAGNAAIFGTVPDGVVAARLTLGGLAVDVPVRDNVVAALLPFPYQDGVRVDLTRRPAPSPPRVGIVDGGGDAMAMRERLAAAGYESLPAVIPGVKRQRPTVVYWRPQQATRAEAAGIAAAAGARGLVRIVRDARAPRPVLDAAAPVVVVVGRR